MKTFFYTLYCTLTPAIIWWFWAMISTKPKWDKKRFKGNWNEGGYQLLLMLLGLSIAISIAISKFILWMNFLEG